MGKKKENIESKRGVLEFLWEWAEEKGNWAKLLLHEVLNTSESLSADKLKLIYRHFRKNIGLNEDIERVEMQKPNSTFSGKSIQLTKLYKITGLNRLSSDSVIEFSPNLTVIYGENGTGKSGFSRILKDIGYSYEAETKLIPNIYSEDNQDMSAEIEYICDGATRKFTWKPETKTNELKDISVYNNSCVAISLSGNRNLIVTPLGFSLFDRVSSELDALKELLSNEKRELITTFDWFETFHEGTIYQDAIQKLQNLKSPDIEKLSIFNPDDQKKLTELEKALTSTNKELIEKEILELNTQKSELMEIKQNIEESMSIFCEDQWTELLITVDEIKKLEERGYSSLEELANEKGIELYGKVEFEDFIKAADVYINTFPNGNYPDLIKSKCIYCNQTLQETASVDLIKRYKTILNDTTQQEIEKQKEKYSALKETFKKITSNIQLHHSSYNLDKENKPIQPEYLKTFNASILRLKQCIENEKYDDIVFNIDYKSVIIALQNRIDEINQLIIKKDNIFVDIESEKLKLTNEINILNDKQLFTNKKNDILKIIDHYSILSILIKYENYFSTTSISAKTSKARKELIERNFTDAFSTELSNLRKSNINIEISFETKKGETNIRQRLQERYSLSDILSEGEQKAISLAEYFTELSIDGSNSTVVLDDPVNSLDHHIIDEVAKRLIKISSIRQTVVFTHSILLFNSLLHEVNQPYNKLIQKRFYHTSNQYHECGVISEADEEINSPKYYISLLNAIIDNPKKDRPEKDVATEGYNHLRAAIEITVEHEILKGTVKRYQKNVALSNFCKLSGEDIDKNKALLNDIFEKCCNFTSAHSKAQEIASTPDMTLLKSDYEAFKKIRDVFKNR